MDNVIIESKTTAGEVALAAQLAKMTPSKREQVLMDLYSAGYREEVRRLIKLGVEQPEENE